MVPVAGDKGDPVLVIRCGFSDFGKLQRAIEERKITPISAESEYIPLNVIELPEDRAGALLELLEQFATRGVNLTLLASRPIGDRMGRYRFVIDAEGHVRDERVADALLGVKRYSPRVVFLGSYPRADRIAATTHAVYDDDAFRDAREWLHGVTEGRVTAEGSSEAGASISGSAD